MSDKSKTPDTATGNKLADDDVQALWKVSDIARRLGICRRTVNNMMTRGLPFLKLGRSVRFIPASVESWLLRQQRGQS